MKSEIIYPACGSVSCWCGKSEAFRAKRVAKPARPLLVTGLSISPAGFYHLVGQEIQVTTTLNHLPALTPCSRAVDIRSVQTSGSTQSKNSEARYSLKLKKAFRLSVYGSRAIPRSVMMAVM